MTGTPMRRSDDAVHERVQVLKEWQTDAMRELRALDDTTRTMQLRLSHISAVVDGLESRLRAIDTTHDAMRRSLDELNLSIARKSWVFTTVGWVVTVAAATVAAAVTDLFKPK